MTRSRATLFALALAYFGCYVPYSAITKALTSPAIAGGGVWSGLALVPVTTIASTVAMFATLSALGWWRYARRPDGTGWPRPNRWTFLSGIATATILITTTLAYTFDGVSIVFVMLVMRGGVLVIAPIVDAMTGRSVRWFSWAALALSLLSLGNALVTRVGPVPLLCAIDLALYLLGYFVRLRLMARLGKSEDQATRRRYFVEEQMVATPAALVLLAAFAWLGPTAIAAPLRDGFTGRWADPAITWAVVAGVCSQGTGVFGGLMLLDAQETTYCVPLNRAASILGGVVATALLAAGFGLAYPTGWELAGAALLVVSIVVLWIGPQLTPARRAVAGDGKR
jgi:drug/metabolite transporter (DMT)-like permease